MTVARCFYIQILMRRTNYILFIFKGVMCHVSTDFQFSILKLSPGFGITIFLNPAFSKTLPYGTCAS